MSEVACDSIKAFAPTALAPDFEQPSVIMLTFSQLRQLIASAVAEAVAPLETRIDDLEDRLNRAPEAQNRPENPGQVVGGLEGKIEALKAELDDNHYRALREIAADRQRLSKLERPATEPEESPLVDRLADHMQTVGLVQVSFAGAAKILGVTPGRISQIKGCILRDPRFEIRHARSHKQKLLIRLVDVRPLKTV